MSMKLIVGLGNLGKEYDGTRHNVGFDIVDALASRFGVSVKKKKFGGLIGECNFEETKLLLLKPQKYMNRSGQVVATAAGFYRVPVEDIIVLADDMALEPGRIRIRSKGSSGGHNGLGDIIEKFGSEEFVRLRVGIGSCGVEAGESYVLGRPTAEQRKLIAAAVERSVDAIVCWLSEGVEAVMNKYNARQDEAVVPDGE